MSYDGVNRRMDNLDHDLLQQIANDVKHIAKWAEKHDSDDIKRFEKVEKEIDLGKRVLYGGVGVILFVEFVLKFIK